MSVSGVSSTDSLYQINQQNGWQQVMNDFSQVGQSLQSGDLAGAQQAFAALKTSHHHHHHSGGTQGTSGDSGGSSTIGNDLNTLATALQSGISRGHKRHLHLFSRTCKILVELRVRSRPAKPVSRIMISTRSQRPCSRAISQAPNRRLHHSFRTPRPLPLTSLTALRPMEISSIPPLDFLIWPLFRRN
jgi:hypothetical protein